MILGFLLAVTQWCQSLIAKDMIRTNSLFLPVVSHVVVRMILIFNLKTDSGIVHMAWYSSVLSLLTSIPCSIDPKKIVVFTIPRTFSRALFSLYVLPLAFHVVSGSVSFSSSMVINQQIRELHSAWSNTYLTVVLFKYWRKRNPIMVTLRRIITTTYLRQFLYILLMLQCSFFFKLHQFYCHWISISSSILGFSWRLQRRKTLFENILKAISLSINGVLLEILSSVKLSSLSFKQD